MAVARASRFAVLKLEDDDILESENKSSPSVQNKTQSNKNKGNTKPGANDSKAKPKKKKKNTNEIAELQSLAFSCLSISKTKHKPSSNSSKVVNASQKQWEEWMQKDSEFVSETYEQDLQEALLLSKIDYEEKKEVYDALQKENELNKQGISKKKKKNHQKKDKSIMSLEEFQNFSPSQVDSSPQKGKTGPDESETSSKSPPADETDFFHKIEEDAGKIITKEQRQNEYKIQNSNYRPVNESALVSQYQEELRKKDEEIAKLNELVQRLKDELKNVRSRNKKLYGILESGEMREKAEILVQIEQLLSVKDELNEQLSEYHTALEQERSKVHSLQTELKKCQNSKKRTESK